MFRKILSILCALGFVLAASALGDTLVVTQDSMTIVGGTYDMVRIQGRKHTTLRNVTVRNTLGTNYYAGIHVNGSTYTTIESCTVDGGASAVPGRGTCGGIKGDGAAYLMIKDCHIYNLNDDGIRLFASSYLFMYNNEINQLLGHGIEDNPPLGCTCNNGHSDGIQFIDCNNVEIVGNIIYNVHSTSCIFMGNSTTLARNVLIANNILHLGSGTDQAYYTVYMWYGMGVKFLNNTIWGYRSGGGSIWYGVDLYDFVFMNNIIKYVKFKNGGSYNAAEHTIRYNLFNTAFNYGSSNLQGVDPQMEVITPANSVTNVTRNDFALKSTSPCIDAGFSDSGALGYDMYRMARVDNAGTANTGGGAITYYDMGAIEYGATRPKTHFMAFPAYVRQAPGKFEFINMSASAFTSWKWDFGDGSTSTERAPKHIYANVDTYTVKLVGYSTAGNDSMIRTNYAMVRGTPVGVDELPLPAPPAALVHVVPEPMINSARFTLNERLVTSGTEIVIFDGAGQLVRRLTSAAGHEVTTNVQWNGKDEAGQRVGPGIYLYCLTGGGETLSGRIVKIR
jgi:PKD repeat protein